jgi:16S rRNA (cytosine1402-N4)-methyltransferase
VSETPAVPGPGSEPTPVVHRRRPRYPGRNPRKFEHKYKELRAGEYPEAAAHIEARGKTLAGSHRPIMVAEILEVLAPKPGERGVDCTLGHAGHALALLERLRADGASGQLLGLDIDPLELPRAGARLLAAGHGPEAAITVASNFAGLHGVLESLGWSGADVVLADLGVSSMQIDNPDRGFTFKFDGPLDLRLNPQRGVSAADWLAGVRVARLEATLRDGADEPRAARLAVAMVEARAKTPFRRTKALADWLRAWSDPATPREEVERFVRRVFQALRIAINDEYSALETWLRNLPGCLNPGGRVAVLTFHSGEDRRVKAAFREGLQQRLYSAIADEVIRPSPDEQRANPRSSSAKLRWAVRAEDAKPSASGGVPEV